MSNRFNVHHMQASQEQELVPLTPEVAMEIEKLLIKNAEALQDLMARHTAGRSPKEIKRQQRAMQFSNS